jgi:hypothetical protein
MYVVIGTSKMTVILEVHRVGYYTHVCVSFIFTNYGFYIN